MTSALSHLLVWQLVALILATVLIGTILSNWLWETCVLVWMFTLSNWIKARCAGIRKYWIARGLRKHFERNQKQGVQ